MHHSKGMFAHPPWSTPAPPTGRHPSPWMCTRTSQGASGQAGDVRLKAGAAQRDHRWGWTCAVGRGTVGTPQVTWEERLGASWTSPHANAARCLFHKYTASRPVGATLVVARGWAGTRPAPTGAGLTKWTSSALSQLNCRVGIRQSYCFV